MTGPSVGRTLFVELSAELLRKGHAQVFRGVGFSMFPNLLPRLPYEAVPAPLASLEPGDVVLLSEGASRFVAHRLLGVGPEGLITKGDACTGPDPPHATEAYLGRLTALRLGPLRLPLSPMAPLLTALFGRPDPAFCSKLAYRVVRAYRTARRLAVRLGSG